MHTCNCNSLNICLKKNKKNNVIHPLLLEIWVLKRRKYIYIFTAKKNSNRSNFPTDFSPSCVQKLKTVQLFSLCMGTVILSFVLLFFEWLLCFKVVHYYLFSSSSFTPTSCKSISNFFFFTQKPWEMKIPAFSLNKCHISLALDVLIAVHHHTSPPNNSSFLIQRILCCTKGQCGNYCSNASSPDVIEEHLFCPLFISPLHSLSLL